MLKLLLSRLWRDECGAVVCTEYLMLGSIVAAGSASGLVAMRDAMVEEYKEFADNIRQIRRANQTQLPPANLRVPGATTGTTATANAPDHAQLNPNPKFMVP